MLYLTQQQIAQAKDDSTLRSKVSEGAMLDLINELSQRIVVLEQLAAQRISQKSWCVGMSGYLGFVLDSDAENISAAELNAAEAGSLARTFQVTLGSMGDNPFTHTWASFAPSLTAAVICDDGDIAIPTMPSANNFDRGVASIRVVFDTDAGATKTYISGDKVTVTIRAQAPGNGLDDTLLGWPVAPVTKTYNVIA